MTQSIHHEGIVKQIDGNHILVTIMQLSACSGCAAKSMCNSAESKEKDVDVYSGQRVAVVGRLSDARLAAVLAYGLPLLLLVVVLLLLLHFAANETIAALGCLATVAAYYLILYLFFRRHLQSQFSFDLLAR